MDGVLETGATARLRTTLVYLAKRRFRISKDVAEDLIQATLLTYLEVRDRYPRSEEHFRILVGIFRNKCREHIGRSVRATQALNLLRRAAETGEAGLLSPRSSGAEFTGILGTLLRREDARLVLEALAELRPQAREMFRLISEEGLSRKQLMQRFGLKANTLDSRLHTYRKEFRALLDRRGLDT